MMVWETLYETPSKMVILSNKVIHTLLSLGSMGNWLMSLPKLVSA